jgi:hypothetical protein
MDLITNRPPPADAARPAPPPDAPAPRRARLVLFGVVGLLLVGVGLVWLARYGYAGWLAALLMAVPAALGVGALARAWQVWRRREDWRLAAVAAGAALVLLAVGGRLALSPGYHRLAERRAWQRYQDSQAPAEERWLAYDRAVPPPFRRPQPEVDYLLSRVREYAGLRHMLRQVLLDVDARHPDDPAFDPVRRAAREALDALPPEA